MSDQEPTQPAMQPVMVRMPEDLYKEVRQAAERDDRTISQTIRRAVKQYLATA